MAVGKRVEMKPADTATMAQQERSLPCSKDDGKILISWRPRGHVLVTGALMGSILRTQMDSYGKVSALT